MIDGAPTTCQFPDCTRPSQYVLVWFDPGPGALRRCAVCAAHVEHVHIHALVREMIPLWQKGTAYDLRIFPA